MKTAENAPFRKSLISKGPTRWKSFATGAFAQIMLTGMVVGLSLLLPNSLRPKLREYAVVNIAPEMRWNAHPFHEDKTAANRTGANRKSHVSSAYIQNAFPSPVISRPLLITAKADAHPTAPTLNLSGPLPELALGVSASPTLQAPRAPIQTGDFADFDDAPPAGGQGDSNPLSAVDLAGNGSMASPAIILYKPQPQYTFDALTSKIQGDVLLAVLFSASGSVRVLSLIHGLGYGLDESAETATRQIRFRPARNKKGIPVDTTAVVRATFNLSYSEASSLTASASE